MLLPLAIFHIAELITVGWGKKATQFHGKEGKPKPEDLKQKVRL